MANALVMTDTYQQLDLLVEYKNEFFQEIDTTNEFTATLTDTGSATVGNGVGGILPLIPSDGTVADNDEAYLGLRNLVFTPAAGKTFIMAARVQFTEANTDDANVAVGFTNSVAADLLVDNGAGLRATGTTFAIYKVDGETVWRCVSRNQANATVSVSTATAGGAAYATLEVILSEITSTTMAVSFRVNGDVLADATTGFPIVHRVLYASADPVTPFVGVKNGAGNLETLNVDYLYAATNR